MKISAQTMAAVSGLLDQVLELPLSEREPWLQKLAQTQPEMVPVLREMLAAGQQPDFSQILQTVPRIGGDSSVTVATSALHNGERIGPYLLKRELGVGGMAVVWLAERADGAFKRDVALKLPMLSRLRRDLADRFTRERDILASLEHPNIARLYDAGVAEDGLPYLALEYVEGQPITTWCDSHRYGVRERLKLFLQVLDAVQYAHARHVIHRDIKPSNILVTESGQVRLLDFGIAKLLIEGETAEQTQLTQVYGRAFTVDYASPEQLRGESLNAASDIYALGVVLYELLTGNRPYQLKGGTVAQIEQAIVNAEIAKPSTHIGQEAAADRSTTSVKLAHRLKGDLDAIIVKALAKVAADRYPSAAAFADDLQRYLSGEPVEAQPSTFVYRTGKAMRRHPTRAASAALGVIAVLAAAALLLSRPPAPTVAEPAVAAAPAVVVPDKSIAVLPFVDMSQKRDQEYFSDGLSEELINRLAHAADLKVIARTSSFQFKGKNEDVRSIGQKLGVANLLEGSVRTSGKSIRVTAQLVRVSDGSHRWSQTYDKDVSDIFKVQDAIATAVVEALKATMATTSTARAREANTDAYNALLRGRYFRERQTKEDLERSIAAFMDAIRLDPGYALAWAELAHAYNIRALFGWVPASEGYQKARKAADRALQLDPNLPDAHRAVAALEWNFDFDFVKSRLETQRAHELDPEDKTATNGDCIEALGVGDMVKAVRVCREIAATDPLNAASQSDLAWALSLAGMLDEAEKVLRIVLELNPSYAGGQCFLGNVLLAKNQPDGALAAMQKEPDELERNECLPSALWALGRHDEADKLLNLLKSKYSDVAALSLAETYALRGDKDAAFEWLDRAYRNREPQVTLIRSDPYFRAFHDDPRYIAFLRKMKLAD